MCSHHNASQLAQPEFDAEWRMLTVLFICSHNEAVVVFSLLPLITYVCMSRSRTKLKIALFNLALWKTKMKPSGYVCTLKVGQLNMHYYRNLPRGLIKFHAPIVLYVRATVDWPLRRQTYYCFIGFFEDKLIIVLQLHTDNKFPVTGKLFIRIISYSVHKQC